MENQKVKELVENTQTFHLANGETVGLKLSFARLYRLRAALPQLYEKYNKVMMDGAKDTFDFLMIIYTAYVCEKIEKIDECMSFEEFIELVPLDMNSLPSTAMNMLAAKKK